MARLAGLPEVVVQRAREILANFEEKKGTQINPHKLTKAEFVREEPKAFLKLGQELLARIQNLDL